MRNRCQTASRAALSTFGSKSNLATWQTQLRNAYRDVEELLAERGLHADHVTVWRWVQRYAPEMERRLRSRLRPTNDSWRVDETYIRVKGKWVYLYRAVDSSGATIDFLLSAKRDAAAAERFLAKALGGENHPAPRVINTDEHAGYPPAIVRLKAEEALKENCRHRPVQYLNWRPLKNWLKPFGSTGTELLVTSNVASLKVPSKP